MPDEPKQRDFPLSNRITNANQDDLVEFARYLSDVEHFNSTQFQEKFREKFPEIQNYTIEYLGGAKASHYLLTNPVTLEKQVVKITLNTTTAAPLNNAAVNAHRVPVFSSRNISPFTIELNEFCANGTLLEYGNSIKDTKQKIANAIKSHQQLATILMTLGENNTLLPDMKPTHLFVTEQEKIVIANTRSLMTTTNGQFNSETMHQNPAYSPGPGFEPPEVKQ